MSSTEAYAKARKLIDDAHRQDPLYQAKQAGSSKGGGEKVEPTDDEEVEKQDELEYADAVENWIVKLIASTADSEEKLLDIEGGKDILRLAARCQHLERFKTPRSSYPEGKPSYLKWRRDLYKIQANRAMQLLEQAGVSSQERENVGIWVSKTDLKPGKEGGIWGTQLLEDAAVLVFLQDQLMQFATQHSTYTRDKFVDILRKTWRKLSSNGKETAKGLDMPEGLKGIVAEAIEEAQ
ncbi:hypothetical protein CBS101457_003852 [Exobasidium rhododendri]|nr:hypothetical protein CBS101457_003852 [Exobasidium rhododendri]